MACDAITQHGTWATAFIDGRSWLFQARRGRDFVCTQDDRAHPGRHTACDGHGRVVAAWPRRDREVYGHGALHPEWS